MSSNATSALQGFILAALNIAKNNALVDALPAINDFLTSIGKNNSAIGFTTALAKLEVDLLAAIPNMQQTDIQQLASLLQQEIDAWAAQAEANPIVAAKKTEAPEAQAEEKAAE